MGVLHVILVVCAHLCHGNLVLKEANLEQLQDIQLGIKQNIEFITQKIDYFNSVLPILSGKVPFKLRRSCEDGWVGNAASCYLLVTDKMTAAEAQSYCSKLEGYLVELTSEEEKNFVALQFKDWDRIFIGGVKVGLSWRWLNSGRKMDYQNWMKGEPNNSGGTEECIEMFFPEGIWNDIKCYYKKYFVCEKILEKIYHHTNNPTLSTPFRRQREEHWIETLGTAFPYGCNGNINNIGNLNSPQGNNVNVMRLFPQYTKT